jgi:Na+-translocating ferredoxin:NAD+ oxidoreductase subunit G
MASAEGGPVRTVVLAVLVAAAGLLIVNASYQWSYGRIAANERARVVARLNSVLDIGLRSRDLTTTRIGITDVALLGSEDAVDVFVITDGAGAPVATVFATVAPHGYNASINLLIGVSPAGSITGVRTVRHRETRGLGDAIEAAKSDWIRQFDGRSLAAPPPVLWAVDQDDGEFDAITGATVTSRAVVTAVKGTLLYFEQHHDEIYAAAAASAAANDDDDDERAN